MKSRPVYQPLVLETTARRHVAFANGEGAEAARRLAERDSCVQIVVMENGMSESEISDVVNRSLLGSGPDTAFYVTGPESFLWDVQKLLRRARVEQCRILLNVAGSWARRVYCVHCRTVNENVAATIHRCVVCGVHLTVRDHFSRRLGAYMGVVVNAEEPGLIPEPEFIYA